MPRLSMRPLDPEACAVKLLTPSWATRTEQSGECVIWTGGTTNDGYGRTRVGGVGVLVHRVAWVSHHGRDIPEGLLIDHLCRNRACVNPDHLDIVTNRENVHRGAFATATVCVNGHEYTSDSTYLTTTKWGGVRRICRICNAANVRRYKQRKRAVA
jgi:hypothetical protein